MAAFCLLPHYWAYYFETSHDDTRQSQQNCSIFDFSLPGHVTQNEVKRSTFLFLFQNRSAFDISMDLKLYRMILDRSLHDFSISDFLIPGHATQQWSQSSKWIVIAHSLLNLWNLICAGVLRDWLLSVLQRPFSDAQVSYTGEWLHRKKSDFLEQMLKFPCRNEIWITKKCFKIFSDCLIGTKKNVGNQTHFHQISLKWGNFLECGYTDTWLQNPVWRYKTRERERARERGEKYSLKTNTVKPHLHDAILHVRCSCPTWLDFGRWVIVSAVGCGKT